MRRTCLLLSLALLLVLPLAAEAADMRATSSTQFLWFNDSLSGQDDEMFAEYLKMSITKLNQENTITIHGYGRGTYSLADDAAESDEELLGRLYYFYLDYRDVVQNVDLVAGRHFVNLPAGSALIDGATVNIRNIGPIGLRLLGGRNVLFSGDRNEIGGSDDSFMGAGISTDVIKLTHIEAAYARKTDDSDVARETVGITITTYLPKRIAVYGEAKYDLLSETTSELLAGIKFSPLERLTLTGEYYQSYPTFDATSIYSVFAVNQYQESLIKAEYALTEDYKLFMSYAAEDFDDGEDANRYEAGIAARPIADLALNVSYDRRNGYGGELSGIRFNGRYSVTSKTAVSAGIDWDDFRRETFEDETVKKYWVGGTHRFNETISLMVRAEDNVNVKYDQQYQGVATVNAEF
ncbi:MAG: hypothetical protein A2010_07030 [Nitrospirae bacterium GWD2_57_9]|nr:MAG: hypothetical protein A2010_07030 [Nitrospirae bacterium GWD2_57_9]